MNTIEILHKDSAYQTIRPYIDTIQNTHWCFMHAPSAHQGECYRPCFNTQLMRDMHAFLRRTASHIKATPSERLSHVVLASDADVFNLGGDLNLFANHIRQGNRESLLAYAKECIEGVHTINSNLHSNAHTVALVQGDALGGGLELALSCTTVIAEIGVQMGFPEVLFGLFPGMGAYTLISRKTSHKVADDLMSNGLVYRSEELYEMGLVDILAEKGEGVAAANEFIRKNRRIAPTRCALNKIRSEFNKIDYSELLKVAEIWVDCAMSLSERSLKTMERLVAAQNRRVRNFAPHNNEAALMAG
jgi:DSF synthase